MIGPSAEPCQIGEMPTEPEVYPHTFTAENKRTFFEGLKVLRPELVDLMQNDGFVHELRDRFGGVFVFYKSEAERIMDEGRKVLF